MIARPLQQRDLRDSKTFATAKPAGSTVVSEIHSKDAKDAKQTLHGVLGHRAQTRQVHGVWETFAGEISDWLLELRNIIARCAPGKFTL